MTLAITEFLGGGGIESLWDTRFKNYEKKKNIQSVYHRQRFRNFVDTFCPLNNDQIIVTFNFIQAHSFLLKNIYPEQLKIV